jgi:hypothetical protein
VVLGVCALAAVVTVLTGAAGASRPPTAAKAALAAIDRQAARGHLTPAEAARYRAAVNRTVLLARRVPAVRAALLQSQLRQAAAIAPVLTAPRALAVFSQLEANDDWFSRHGPPAPQSDLTDADGVVYRYFPGKGFEFHPLGNFAALNATLATKNVAATARLANALLARAVPDAHGGTGWEYYFDYSGGRAPWRSGFAQAVAAQALARAAALDTADAPALHDAARRAYRSLPGHLVESTSFGPWIKLYSFNRAVVLNAQLQSAISLADYAKAENDEAAATLVDGLKAAAARALPHFSTGYWSYYALPAELSDVHYQDYVIQLLGTLARRDDRFTDAAARFATFSTQPPLFKLANAAVGAVTFWVSKPSSVSVSALGGVRRFSVGGGWHTVSWPLPSRAGIFPVTIHATDWLGNRSAVDALPIVHIATPPKHHKRKPVRKVTAVTAGTATLPPLLVGAGLDQPAQAPLAVQQGFGAVRMTLVWPAGAATPDPGAVAALGRLPASTNLTLELYTSPAPSDDVGRAALAAYAAALAQQVPTLRDLVVGPAPATAAAGAYETTLAAVYDAVKAANPAVRVAGALDGSVAPRSTLAAVAAAYRTSGRLGPVMDELAFAPAPAAGKNLWPLASIPTLVTTLGADFASGGQPGSALPLIVDGISVQSAIPAGELGLYSSPSAGTTGVDEATQAAAYTAALKTVACRQNVIAVLLGRLVDGPAPGAQSGLFYPDGTPKTSLTAVAQAVADAQSPARGCSSASTAPTPPAPTPPAPTPTPTPTPTPAPAPAPTPAPTTPPAGQKPVAVDAPDQLTFPARISSSSAPSVHLGCTAACLYLVTLQRARDGAPVLARRGEIPRAGARTVTLPKAPAAGSYRFAVWIVAQANPGPVSIDRSPVVSAR